MATNHTLRHAYYVACLIGLEILQLLLNRSLELIPILTPIGVYVGLLVVSQLVWWHQESDLRVVFNLSRQQREYFYHEFFIYVLVALLAYIVFREVLGQPVSDVLYAILFILILGFFAALENTLAAIRRWYGDGERPLPGTFRLLPISVMLGRTVLLVMSGVLLCLAVLIFRFHIQLGAQDAEPAILLMYFGLEALFFFLLLGYLMWRISHSYARNFHHIIESQFRVLRDALAGDYTHEVPLLSQGELGLMGMQLNRLLEYMRKREHVEKMLKRVVSPDIMETLLSTDVEQLKHGEEREMAVLFCDIRGFTEMSEGATATEIIFFLNSFFSDLADMVARNHGTINKFMGDAILAVYSGDTATEAIDAAMNTANEITMRVRQMRLPSGAAPETGTGIHFGRVVAGTIGSKDRYEYTFLGDAVNTASRLQGLSKRFGYPVIVSADAYDMLSDYLKSNLTDLGQHMVRGKAEAVHIYGGPI